MTERCLIERYSYAISRSSMDVAVFVDDAGRLRVAHRINSLPINRLAHRQVAATLRALEAEAREILARESREPQSG